MFVSFSPAISRDALNKIGREVRSWRLHRRIGHSFGELARWINPIVRGWMQYYGAFYRSALYPLLTRINAYLMRWVRRKYRRFKGRHQLQRAWQRVTDAVPAVLRALGLDHRRPRRLVVKMTRARMTRLCRAPDYAELTSRSACPGWSRRWTCSRVRHIHSASRKASRVSGGR